tara:strand:+ start:92 stop:679 length:588 start_codon:yes stop_codon:yes gene_type:complete
MQIIRKYNSYPDYIKHQKEKSLDPSRIKKWLNGDWQPKVDMFYNHFKRNEEYLIKGGKALGVCARTGQEIEALKQLGMDAIGVDIVAYPPLVVLGDAHHLPFENETFDFVFSNSLDHSIYPLLFLEEMRRVLKIGGYGILHLQITRDVDGYAENILFNEKPVIKLLSTVKIVENREIKDICYHREIVFKKQNTEK